MTSTKIKYFGTKSKKLDELAPNVSPPTVIVHEQKLRKLRIKEQKYDREGPKVLIIFSLKSSVKSH